MTLQDYIELSALILASLTLFTTIYAVVTTSKALDGMIHRSIAQFGLSSEMHREISSQSASVVESKELIRKVMIGTGEFG